MPEPARHGASRVKRPDEVFDWLRDAHAGLSPEESRGLDARLVLLLINENGDEETIRSCIEAAKRAGGTRA